jgi:DNA primase
MENSLAGVKPQRTPEITHTRPERRGVSRRTVIEEAKAKVSTIDLADRLAGPGKMRKVGAEWVTNCPLPDHEDRSPSFAVNPEKNVWFCYGCLRGGDVVELARFAWGYEKHQAATAAADLLREFGHELPPRPANWYAKQQRQELARSAIEGAKVRHAQRRIFRIFLPLIEELDDQSERREETEYLWDAAREIAVLVVAGRRE